MFPTQGIIVEVGSWLGTVSALQMIKPAILTKKAIFPYVTRKQMENSVKNNVQADGLVLSPSKLG